LYFIDNDELNDKIDIESQRVNKVSIEGKGQKVEDELEYIEKQIVYSATSKDNEQELLYELHNDHYNKIVNKTINANRQVVRVYSSSKKSSLYDLTNDAKLFPHLFPFGRGHPGESRYIRVSREECVAHYLRLSTRAFDRDSLYALYAFDQLSLQRALTQSYISCKSLPTLYRNFGEITKDHLELALKNKEKAKVGRNIVEASNDSDKNVYSFLKNIQYCSSFMWGSNAERVSCRQEAFATADRYGQPTIFLTIAPNSDLSLTLAYLAGHVDIDSFIEMKFEDHKLSKIKLEKIAHESNVSTAILYDYIIKTLFGIAVGIYNIL
jgi:hypothetical protein